MYWVMVGRVPFRTKIDYRDLQILSEFQANCRIRICELALKIGLAQSTTAERVRRLEKEGIILGYSAIINEAYLGVVNQMRQPSIAATDEGRRPYFETVLNNLDAAVSVQKLANAGGNPINIKERKG